MSGGKGNKGMFIDWNLNICAAGQTTSMSEPNAKDLLKQYSLQDEVDAFISDAIIPEPTPRTYNLRKPALRDMRNAGIFSDGAQLINPPTLSKTQELINDLKQTTYSSYWNKELGRVRDPVPYLPPGFDTLNTTLGKKSEDCGRLYDVIMPKTSVRIEKPDIQTDRNYCRPPYNPNITFGKKTNADKRGCIKICLTDDRLVLGTALKTTMNTFLAENKKSKEDLLGVGLAPNNNISCVPIGHAFGKVNSNKDGVPECLIACKINPNRELYNNCLSHLNSLRKCLSKKFEGNFFHNLYLKLKYFDKEKSGRLPKEVVYKHCNSLLIIFTPSLLEPLLSVWNAFNGSEIDYKIFTRVIDYRIPSLELPKIPYIPRECDQFTTTYREMVKPGQEMDERHMAGEPSGKYFTKDFPVTPNNCCKADRFYLPEESNANACLSPSVLSLMGISHREMYAKREPHIVKRVFKAAGETFTDEKFDRLWKEAEKYHSHGWVSYETFRRALQKQ